jgi:hypothetical protein
VHLELNGHLDEKNDWAEILIGFIRHAFGPLDYQQCQIQEGMSRFLAEVNRPEPASFKRNRRKDELR